MRQFVAICPTVNGPGCNYPGQIKIDEKCAGEGNVKNWLPQNNRKLEEIQEFSRKTIEIDNKNDKQMSKLTTK